MNTPSFFTHLHRLALLGCVGITLSAAAAINDGLVAYYPFEGNARDASGHARDGRLVNGATGCGVTTWTGQAACLDGADDYVQLPYQALDNLPQGTIFAQLFLEEYGTSPSVFVLSKGTSAFTEIALAVQEFSGHTLYALIGNTTLLGTQVIPLRRWVSVAFTWDGSRWRLYVDGLLDVEMASNVGLRSAAESIYIGHHEHCCNRHYSHGQLDEVRLYDRALSATEIQFLHSTNDPEQAPVLLAHSGNYYKVFTGPMTWAAASSFSESLSYNGWKGHLATVNSQAENDLLADLVKTGTAWIGGYQSAGSPEPDGGWSWVTDEAFAFTAWHAGEPNHTPTAPQDFLQYYGQASMFHRTWNDSGDYPDAFVVEFEPELRMTVQVAQVAICWNSRLNKNYQVEYRTNPATGDWLPLGSAVAGTGLTICVTDSTRSSALQSETETGGPRLEGRGDAGGAVPRILWIASCNLRPGDALHSATLSAARLGSSLRIPADLKGIDYVRSRSFVMACRLLMTG
jgi:hypothetical protein